MSGSSKASRPTPAPGRPSPGPASPTRARSGARVICFMLLVHCAHRAASSWMDDSRGGELTGSTDGATASSGGRVEGSLGAGRDGLGGFGRWGVGGRFGAAREGWCRGVRVVGVEVVGREGD